MKTDNICIKIDIPKNFSEYNKGHEEIKESLSSMSKRAKVISDLISMVELVDSTEGKAEVEFSEHGMDLIVKIKNVASVSLLRFLTKWSLSIEEIDFNEEGETILGIEYVGEDGKNKEKMEIILTPPVFKPESD